MCDQILGSPQQKWMHAAGEKFLPRQVAFAFDGHAIVALEIFFIAEQARHQESKQRPELAQMIFHRRSGQAEPMPRLQSAGDGGGFGFGIFDVLRFIENRQMPMLSEQFFFVAGEQGVGRQYQIEVSKSLGPLMTQQAVRDHHFQARCESRRFRVPGAHHAGGRDYECREIKPSRCFFGREVCECLHGLAETHVVGEDAGQFVFTQKLQPREALLLVWAQGGVKIGWRRHRRDAIETCEACTELAHAFAAQPAQIQYTIHFRQSRRIERREPDAPARWLAQIKLEQRGQQRLQTRQRQRGTSAIAQRHDDFRFVRHRLQRGRTPLRRRGLNQAHQNRDQADPRALYVDANFQIEPLVR